jgi:positive phototaxis protein PixI
MGSLSQSNSLTLSLGVNPTEVSRSRQIHKFLQFQLGQGDRALVEAEIVTEIITISKHDILPVPQMIYCVLGVYNWRSEMLWIVDLENLLGYPPPLLSSQKITESDPLLVAIVQFQGHNLGLVIPKVDNIVEQDLEQFKSASSELFPEDLLSFLKGYCTNSNNEIVMLIDVEEIGDFLSI